jgi:hypothetical protein
MIAAQHQQNVANRSLDQAARSSCKLSPLVLASFCTGPVAVAAASSLLPSATSWQLLHDFDDAAAAAGCLGGVLGTPAACATVALLMLQHL